MKGSTLVVLIIICAVLAYFSFAPDSKKGAGSIDNKEPLKGFDINQVDKVELSKGKEKLIIEYKGAAWRASSDELDFPIDFKKLQEFMRSVKDMKLVDKKTKSDKHDKKFGLDTDSSPTSVTFYKGSDKLHTLTLGKVKMGEPAKNSPFPMPKEFGHYLRIDDDKTVFESKDKIKVDIASTFWMKAKLVEVKKDEITKVEYAFPHKKYQLEKKKVKKETVVSGNTVTSEEETWVATGDLPEGKQLDANEMGTLLDRLKEISVSQPISKKKQAELSKTFPYTLKVSRGDNALYDIRIQVKEETWYVHLASTPGELYQIDNWRIEQIFAYSKNLFKLSDQKLSEKQIRAIEYVDKGMKFEKSGESWKPHATAPYPEIKEDKVKGTAELLGDFDLADYHIHNVSQDYGPETIFHLVDGKKVIVRSVGSIFLQDAHLITIEGKSQVYSVEEHVYNKLFPKQKDILGLEMKPSALDDFTEIVMPGGTFVKKDGQWSLKGSKGVVQTNNLKSWIASLKVIYDSPFSLMTKNFPVKTTLKLKDKEGKSLQLSISDGVKGFAQVKSSQFGGVFNVQWDVLKAMIKTPKDFVVEAKPVVPIPVPEKPTPAPVVPNPVPEKPKAANK